jgi:hypothetical protein
MTWARHVAHKVERRKTCRILVKKPEGMRLLGRSRCRWEDNNELNLGEI